MMGNSAGAKTRYTLIHGGYDVPSFVVMSAILGRWRREAWSDLSLSFPFAG